MILNSNDASTVSRVDRGDSSRAGDRCSRCLLLYDLPGIDRAAHDICTICAQFKPIAVKGETFLKEALTASLPGDRTCDCIVPVSGGFDSMYTAFYLTRRLGLRCRGIHYDNSISDQGKWEMLEWIEKELEIPIRVHRWSDQKTQANIRDGIRSMSVFGPRYVQAAFCRHCGYGIRASVASTMVQYGVHSVWGKHTYDVIPFQFCLNVNLFRFLTSSKGIDAFKYLLGRYDQATKVPSPGLPPRKLFFRKYGYPALLKPFDHLHNFAFFDFIAWDKEKMLDELNEAGVNTAFLIQSHTDCLVHKIYDRMLQNTWGAGQDEIHICNRVRTGQLTPEKGIEHIKEIRSREISTDFLRDIGLTPSEIDALFTIQDRTC
ncbi:hypothetical protein JXQ70_06940 [bacterium]|nr:hypothetical protein [bacterium]